LRLLEKKKKRKILRREQATALDEGGAQHRGGTDLRREQKAQLSAKSPPSTRAKYLALGEEPPFNESQIFGSRRRALHQREPDICLSAKEWPPLLTEGRAVTVRGPSARAKDASRRMSAERIQ
jgi:hypothetical protein